MHSAETIQEGKTHTEEEIMRAQRVLADLIKEFQRDKDQFDRGKNITLEIPNITDDVREALQILLIASRISGKDLFKIGEILGEKKANGSKIPPHPLEEIE